MLQISSKGSPMPYFRKRPIVVEAIQYRPHDNCGAVAAFMDGKDDFECEETENDEWAVDTLEGTMFAQPGDWIIKGAHGEFYPCKPDIFEDTYELVGDQDTEMTTDEIMALTRPSVRLTPGQLKTLRQSES
jgi:hypothetical protein